MSRSLRVVVADGETAMQERLRGMLAVLCHIVVGASRTGRGLVRTCRESRPELVIAAVGLPDIDGFEAAERIEGHATVPVILYAPHPDAALIARAQRAPALSYLITSIRPEELATAITFAVHRSEVYQNLCRQRDELESALASHWRLECHHPTATIDSSISNGKLQADDDLTVPFSRV